MDEVWHGGCGPGRVDQGCGLLEERWREPGQRIGLRTKAVQELAERTGFLRRHAHALAVNGIEAADRVADGQQTTRKLRQSLVVTIHALRKAKPCDVTESLGLPDGVVHGRRSQLLRVGHESRLVTRRVVAMAPADGTDPSVALKG